jgi:hypothetical protein
MSFFLLIRRKLIKTVLYLSLLKNLIYLLILKKIVFYLKIRKISFKRKDLEKRDQEGKIGIIYVEK